LTHESRLGFGWPGFGWLKDEFDPRDYYYRVPPIIKIPDFVDLSALLPNIRDQGQEGSCVGFGVGINLTMHAKAQNVFSEWFGPRWIYNGARELEGRLGEEGAYPRDAFEFLRKYGCLLESFWRYFALVDSDRPASAHPNAPKAKDYPIISYSRVVDGLDGICGALAAGNPVSIGMPWYKSWLYVGSNGLLPVPEANEEIAGGHEVCFYGYDVETARLFVANSWGIYWGDRGKCYMPFKAIDRAKKDGGYDAHVVKADWSGRPQPQPKSCEEQLMACIQDADDLWQVFSCVLDYFNCAFTTAKRIRRGGPC